MAIHLLFAFIVFYLRFITADSALDEAFPWSFPPECVYYGFTLEGRPQIFYDLDSVHNHGYNFVVDLTTRVASPETLLSSPTTPLTSALPDQSAGLTLVDGDSLIESYVNYLDPSCGLVGGPFHHSSVLAPGREGTYVVEPVPFDKSDYEGLDAVYRCSCAELEGEPGCTRLFSRMMVSALSMAGFVAGEGGRDEVIVICRSGAACEGRALPGGELLWEDPKDMFYIDDNQHDLAFQQGNYVVAAGFASSLTTPAAALYDVYTGQRVVIEYPFIASDVFYWRGISPYQAEDSPDSLIKWALAAGTQVHRRHSDDAIIITKWFPHENVFIDAPRTIYLHGGSGLGQSLVPMHLPQPASAANYLYSPKLNLSSPYVLGYDLLSQPFDLLCAPCPRTIKSGALYRTPDLNCKICPTGSYCDSWQRHPCPEGTYNPSLGAASVEACLPCPAPFFVSNNNTVCNVCSVQHRLYFVGESTCSACSKLTGPVYCSLSERNGQPHYTLALCPPTKHIENGHTECNVCPWMRQCDGTDKIGHIYVQFWLLIGAIAVLGLALAVISILYLTQRKRESDLWLLSVQANCDDY